MCCARIAGSAIIFPTMKVRYKREHIEVWKDIAAAEWPEQSPAGTPADDFFSPASFFQEQCSFLYYAAKKGAVRPHFQ